MRTLGTFTFAAHQFVSELMQEKKNRRRRRTILVMARKAQAPMVEESDPQWVRFWTAFPLKVSKKDARIAWMQINPSLELVDRMLDTLSWQAALWDIQGYGRPYPASWLRGERWTDEAPRGTTPKPIEPTHYATCPHTPKCGSAWECQELKARAS